MTYLGKKVIIKTSTDQDIFKPLIFNFVVEGKFSIEQIKTNQSENESEENNSHLE